MSAINTFVCNYCSKQFTVEPYRKNTAKYCSNFCRQKSWRSPANAVKFKKGITPWNKGRGVNKNCVICDKKFYVWKAHSDRVKCCSKKCGYLFRKKMIGSANPAWKGGITPLNKVIRHSMEYRIWREAVFARDDWTCVDCEDRSKANHPVILHADHIKPFSLYPELRFAIDNGRTLCITCHRQTDTYGKGILNFETN